jgi:hypothetical protein
MARARKQPDLFPAVRQALEPLVARKLRKKIVPGASLLADLGLDSLKVVELTVLLEKQLAGRSSCRSGSRASRIRTI